MDALVSVIIPCYNQAGFLPEAVASVRAQTYQSIEVIVVDDGSPEDVAGVLCSFPEVRCHRRRNGGVSAARNTGFALSRGAFVVFLDADDRLTPDSVCRQVRLLQASPGALAVAGLCSMIDADGNARRFRQERASRDDPYYRLLHRNFIWMPAQVMYRRQAIEAHGGFDSSVNACADYDMYLRLARLGPGHLVCHRAVVAEYRQHGANMSGNAPLMLRTALTALDRQSSWVRDRPRYRAAQARGREFWRGYYGDPIVDDIRLKVRTRTLRAGSLPALMTLVRHYPEAVIANLVRKTKCWLRARAGRASAGSAGRAPALPGRTPSGEAGPRPCGPAQARAGAPSGQL